MSKVEISIQAAKEAYRDATPDIKKTLLKLFGKKVLIDNITELVTSYEDACEIEGIKPLSISNFSHLPTIDQAYAFADHKLTVIRRVLNEGWTWAFGKSGYYPYFYKDKAAGGSGFSCYDYSYAVDFSGVGARRIFKDEKTAIYAGKQFIDLYEIIHTEE